MICYFDSSALVKRYIQEADSDEVCRLLLSSKSSTARFSIVEITSALSRRCREGDIGPKERDSVIRKLNEDMERIYMIELTRETGAIATALLTRRTLRAGDAVQLASALHLQNRIGDKVKFVTYDIRLAEAAGAEGLVIVRA